MLRQDFKSTLFRALEMRRSAQKQLDQEQREHLDKMRSNEGSFDSMKNYGTFDHNQPNHGQNDMFEMFTTGPFKR